jgi:MFS family permease
MAQGDRGEPGAAALPDARAAGDGRSRSRLASATWVFWLMFSINVVNYLDRLLVVALGPTLKANFHLTDRDVGLVSSAFLIIYTVATLPLGVFADRVSHARVVAAGVAVWSVMSASTAFVRSFGGLFFTRVAVGIGEASYFPAGTALLSAYFPIERRARAMSRWGAGQICGATLAFALSTVFYRWLGEDLGWRAAFLVSGVPGLVLACLMWFVPDAPPGAPRVDTRQRGSIRPPLRESGAQMRAVLRIGTVRLGIVLQSLIYIVATPTITFLPIYLRSAHGSFHLSPAGAALLSGGIIVVGGLAGVLLGGRLADWLTPRVRGGRVLTVSVGFGLALPCYAIMLLTGSVLAFTIAGTLAVLALNLPAGPLGAAVQDATAPALRATTVGLGLVLSHLLGDAWASAAVGALSTALGERTGLALLVIGVPALALGAAVAGLGARVYARDIASVPRPRDLLTSER